MYKILRRKQLNDTVVRLDVEAPFIAKKAKAGQFIILRIDERGERMPLTIADTNAEDAGQLLAADPALKNHPLLKARVELLFELNADAMN